MSCWINGYTHGTCEGYQYIVIMLSIIITIALSIVYYKKLRLSGDTGGK